VDNQNFNRVKVPKNKSGEDWMCNEPSACKKVKSRPASPARAPLSPRVKKILKESMKSQPESPRSPRSPRNAYKPEVPAEGTWAPTCVHGGFSKNDNWAYVSTSTSTYMKNSLFKELFILIIFSCSFLLNLLMYTIVTCIFSAKDSGRNIFCQAM
jgi:hypothetical protein